MNTRLQPVTGIVAVSVLPFAIGNPAGASAFTELTTLIDTRPRTITGRDVPQDNDQHHGPHGSDSRWIVSNPYLPMDRHFLPYIWGMSCSRDGTLYVAGESVVPAAESRRQPRSNRFESERMEYEFVVVDREGLPIVGGTHVRIGVEIYGGVYRIHPDGRIEQLFAGRQIAPRTSRQYVGLLTGLAVLADGALIISDGFEGETGNRLLEVRDGGVSRFLGLPTTDPATPEVDGPAARAQFFGPAGLCSAGEDVLFIAPKHQRRPVRKFDLRTKTVTSWLY